MLPPGCPEIRQTGAAGQVIGIRSVNFVTNQIVIQNISNQPQTVLGQTWQWCQFPSYWFISNSTDNITLAPGETLGFITELRGDPEAVLQQASDGQELGIYISSGNYLNPEAMRAFVSWGTGSPQGIAGREMVAVQARLWVSGDRVRLYRGAAGFVAAGNADEGTGYVAVPEPCLAYDGRVVPQIPYSSN
jgi:hypothetical protein